MPNSEPTLFFPMMWAKVSPELWEWVKANALHVEPSYHMAGWKVWFPVFAVDMQEEAA